MTKLKRILYLPEGDVKDLMNFSGTPFYLWKNLEVEISKRNLKLKTMDTKQILNTEDIWFNLKYIIDEKLSIEDILLKNVLGLTQERLEYKPNRELFTEAVKEKRLNKLVKTVLKYYKSVAIDVNILLSKNYQDGDLILFINTLNPYFSLDVPVCYYLDTSLYYFYFDQKRGYLKWLPKKVKEFYWVMEYEAIKKAKKIFCFSKACAKQIEQIYKIEPDKIKIVFAGANLGEIEHTRDYQKKSVKLLFVGRDFELKGGKYLLKAFSEIKLQDVSLTIVTKNEWAKKYKKITQNNPKISWSGALPKNKIIELFKTHDIFVFPTQIDAFGIAVCEAMYFGLPVIATNYHAVPEILGLKNKQYLVPINDFQSLKKMLKIFITDSKLREDVGKNNQKRAKSTFNWPEVINKIIKEMR